MSTGTGTAIAGSGPDGEVSLQDCTVLVVDDDEASRQWFQVCLEADGYRAICVDSGLAALEKVAELRPDLILLDVLMPGMDGFETTRRLKCLRSTRAVPVILATSLNDRRARLEGLEAGAEDFLSKPVDPTELTVRVRNLLRLKRYTDMLQQYNRELEQKVLDKSREVRQQCIDTVLALTRAAEFRDEQTGTHVGRISHYTVVLAEQLGMAPQFRDEIYYASPMHDIGKLAIPDHILLKPGGFNAAEWTVMQSHTTLGKRILEGYHSPFLEMGMDIAQYHHEHWDGSGYPFGLAGEGIPLSSRVMAICDVYDALRSERPYKHAQTHVDTLQIIREGDSRTRPEHFDPEVLTAFYAVQDRFAEIYAQTAALPMDRTD